MSAPIRCQTRSAPRYFGPGTSLGPVLLAVLLGGEAAALTPTRTPTRTRTLTVTRTATYSATPSRTQTGTPTLSGTPTSSRTPSRTRSPTATLTATSTHTPSRTPCPEATPEPLWVEPLTSPTEQYFQIVTVHVGNANTVTIQTESGTFRAAGDFSVANPAQVRVDLRPNTTHHLEVVAHVRAVTTAGGCTYDDYLLRTTTNQFGAPLVIVQSGSPRSPTPTFTPSFTPSASPNTPTATRSRTPTRTRTATVTRTTTAAPSLSPTGTPTTSPTGTATSTSAPTPSPTPTGSASPSPEPTATETVPPLPSATPSFTPQPPCPGDCDAGGWVDASELVRAARITLALEPAGSCRALDPNEDGRGTIDELVSAVAGALARCVAP